MESVNVLTQMKEYNFNKPINVEMIFDESDDDGDTSFQNENESEHKTINDNNNNEQVAVVNNDSEKKCTNSENQINHESLSTSMLSLKPIEEIMEDIKENDLNKSETITIRENTNDVGHYHNQTIPDGNQHATVLVSNDTVLNAANVPVSQQINDHHDPVTSIDKLLNKLSEHIVLIMQAFYHYGVKKPNEDIQKKETIFNFIKSHFFELSYTTVESILLPQQQNKIFINQFLDNTVSIAKSKSLKWSCQRRHVMPFYQELMIWTKKKSEYIKNNNGPCPSNEYVMLKKQLVRPLAPLNLPQTEIVAKHTNIEPPQTQNNLCIFSSGTPGHEISINIDADTFIQITEKQNCGTVAQNVSLNNNVPMCEPTSEKTAAVRPRCGNRVKEIQKTSPQYKRQRRPPPVQLHQNYQHITDRPQQYIQSNANNYNQIYLNQTYYNSIGVPHQNHQQPNPSYPDQIHYINTNRPPPPTYKDHFNNMFYDNSTNYNIPMHGTRMVNQVSSSPVITSVTSLNPKTVRCCMCGKSTARPCGPYLYSMYSPCTVTPIYCSYLCQELDSQFNKRAWPNT